MKNFNIVTKCPVSLYGFKIPIGAAYGKDKAGIWICLRPTESRRGKMISKPHYEVRRDENGTKKRTLITPAKYEHTLVIYRCRTAKVESRYCAGNTWEKCIESGETVEKIIALTRKFPDKFALDSKREKAHLVYDNKSGKWGIEYPPTVSNRSAREVSRVINMCVVREYTPYARPY